MKKILTTAFSLGLGLLSAQNVGIGTATPNISAKLEIVDANRGLLVPRVALTATNVAAPVASPANWLIVFNTNISAPGPFAVTQGLYYWDGAQWVKFQASNTNDWTLLGNAGTNPTTNFIGTTDAQDFVTRTNNTEKMRVTSAGNVGIGTAAPSRTLEVAGPFARITSFNPYVEFNGIFAPTPSLATLGIRTAGEMVLRTNTNNNAIADWEIKSGTGTNASPVPNDCYYVGRRANPTTINPDYFLFIGNSGNVGINTITPTDRLQVANGNARIGEVNGAGSGAFPNAGRELYFSGGLSSGAFNSDNSDPLYIRRYNQANDQSDLQIVIGDNVGTPNNDRLTIGDNSAQRIALSSSGHVGINTLLPATNLHVVGSTRLEQNAATLQLAGTVGGHSYIEYYSQGIAAGRQGYVGFPSNGSTDFNFYNENAAGNINLSTPFSGANPELSIRANGNVGIGTAAPTTKLHLENGQFQQRTTTDVSQSLYMNNTASNRGWQLYHLGSTDANAPNGFMFEYFNGTSWARRMTIAQGGQVGINTSIFSSIFNVQGNIELQNVGDNMLLSRNDGQARNIQMIGTYMGWDQRGIYLAGYNQNNIGGSFSDANRVYCGGSFGSIPITATAFTVASSQRYKQNIIPTLYGLSAIMQLRPVQYQYNFDKLEQTHVGLIAEEVNKVIPEIVVKQDEKGEETKDLNGKTMGVNYSELVPVLIKAVQEQQQQIETQQQQIKQLQQKIEDLNKK